MARPRKSEAEKALDIFAKYAESKGIVLEKADLLEKISLEDEKAVEIDLALDGVLLTLHKPHSMMEKVCHYCHEKFLTDYCSVGYCCNEHRRLDLAKIGIIFDGSPNNRWGRVEPPVVIPPELLATLQEWAKRILTKSPASPVPNQIPAGEQGLLWEPFDSLYQQGTANHQQYPRQAGVVPLTTLDEVLDMLDFLD